MTRKKKSRKVINNGTARLSKDKLRELRAQKEQRAKKKKGAVSGNRNSQLLKTEQATDSQSTSKDTRVGSKKPISLTPTPAPEVKKPAPVQTRTPQANLVKNTAPALTPEQELAQIEGDERLMALLERHESGEVLQGKDAKYFNAKVERHQALCELLGLDDDDDMDDDEDLLDSYMNDSLAEQWLDEDEER